MLAAPFPITGCHLSFADIGGKVHNPEVKRRILRKEVRRFDVIGLISRPVLLETARKLRVVVHPSCRVIVLGLRMLPRSTRDTECIHTCLSRLIDCDYDRNAFHWLRWTWSLRPCCGPIT